METAAVLTVYFDDPFWVGVYERKTENGLEACRVVFGAEPKDYEVYDFFLRHWNRLHFSPPVAGCSQQESKRSPKRMQREIHRQLLSQGIGTKAQQALKLQREQAKRDGAIRRRERTELEKRRKFELQQQKKKEKHRGR